MAQRKIASSPLGQGQFNSTIRFIKSARLETLEPLFRIVVLKLGNLDVNCDPTKAVAGIPNGSDQVDVGSFVTWLNGVADDDPNIVAQVIAIEATMRVRVKG